MYGLVYLASWWPQVHCTCGDVQTNYHASCFNRSYLYYHVSPLTSVTYSATTSHTFSRQQGVNCIGVRGRNDVVNMMLVDLVEMKLGPICGWPSYFLCYLFVDVPNRRNVNQLSAFFFGNGLPYGLACRVYKAWNPTVPRGALETMFDQYSMWRKASNTSHMCEYYNMRIGKFVYVNGSSSEAGSDSDAFRTRTVRLPTLNMNQDAKRAAHTSGKPCTLFCSVQINIAHTAIFHLSLWTLRSKPIQGRTSPLAQLPICTVSHVFTIPTNHNSSDSVQSQHVLWPIISNFHSDVTPHHATRRVSSTTRFMAEWHATLHFSRQNTSTNIDGVTGHKIYFHNFWGFLPFWETHCAPHTLFWGLWHLPNTYSYFYTFFEILRFDLFFEGFLTVSTFQLVHNRLINMPERSGRITTSDDLWFRHTQRKDCLPLADSKCNYGEIGKATIQLVEWHWKLNICLLAVPKYDLCGDDKSMILGVESPCEIIFCLLGIQKCYMVEVEEVMF
jgi:hypothetical protein